MWLEKQLCDVKQSPSSIMYFTHKELVQAGQYPLVCNRMCNNWNEVVKRVLDDKERRGGPTLQHFSQSWEKYILTLDRNTFILLTEIHCNKVVIGQGWDDKEGRRGSQRPTLQHFCQSWEAGHQNWPYLSTFGRNICPLLKEISLHFWKKYIFSLYIIQIFHRNIAL